MGLGLKRLENETWYECAMRYAWEWGMEVEVDEWYTMYKEEGLSDEDAAFSACYEWDICDLM